MAKYARQQAPSTVSGNFSLSSVRLLHLLPVDMILSDTWTLLFFQHQTGYLFKALSYGQSVCHPVHGEYSKHDVLITTS